MNKKKIDEQHLTALIIFGSFALFIVAVAAFLLWAAIVLFPEQPHSSELSRLSDSDTDTFETVSLYPADAQDQSDPLLPLDYIVSPLDDYQLFELLYEKYGNDIGYVEVRLPSDWDTNESYNHLPDDKLLLQAHKLIRYAVNHGYSASTVLSFAQKNLKEEILSRVSLSTITIPHVVFMTDLPDTSPVKSFSFSVSYYNLPDDPLPITCYDEQNEPVKCTPDDFTQLITDSLSLHQENFSTFGSMKESLPVFVRHLLRDYGVTAVMTVWEIKVSSPHRYSYVVNTNTGKIHRSTCYEVKKILEENRIYTDDSAMYHDMGYSYCQKCLGNMGN